MSVLRILHLEDNRHDAELVQATLAADGLRANIRRVDSRETFQAALESDRWDVILADYNLPVFDGLSAQVLAERLRPETPFIFLSGSIGEELAIERVKAGATDYVLKDRMARLPSAVRRALAEAAERAERRRAEGEVLTLNAELERRVAERTAALARANDALAAREHDLRESEERTRSILRTANDAFVGMDAGGRIVEWNEQAERMFGWPHAEIQGRLLADVIIPEQHRDAHRRGLARYLATGEGPVLNKRIELMALRRNGAEFPVELTIWASGGPGDRRFNGFVRDITEQKAAEAAVRLAREEAERANRAKSEFLSRMSHDLRTPLNAILGFAQLLESTELGEEERESVEQILRGGEHLLALINEVLDIARIESGHLSLSPEPLCALDVVQQVVELVGPLAAQRGIDLQIADTADAGIFVRADRQRLNQILMNLLSNAVKYNRPNGRVFVGFESVDHGRMRITVSDTGAGIPPAKMALLFQPFERLGAEQTEVEGTGLGLAVARALAEAMGGALGVSSQMDQGSTFWVELSLSGEPSVRHDAVPDTGVIEPDGERTAGVVLYIEDNHSNLRLMERVLRRRPGVRLLHAPRGDDGLRLAREKRPDLILLDLHLPDMTGEEVLRHLWEDAALRTIPVAVLSADATSAHSRRLQASGAIAYLTKPLDITRVLKLLDDSLNQDGRTLSAATDRGDPGKRDARA